MYTVQQGERVAQLLCESILKPAIQHVEKLAQRQRAEGGFGSTNEQPVVRIALLQNISLLAVKQLMDSDIAPVYQAVQRKTLMEEINITEQSAAPTPQPTSCWVGKPNCLVY